MKYFVFFDEDESLHFGSAYNVIDDFGEIELKGIKEMYTAGENGIRLYTDSDPNWMAEKRSEGEDEPPLLFGNMEECIKHALGMIVNLMYDKGYLLNTIFEYDFSAWTKLVRYL